MIIAKEGLSRSKIRTSNKGLLSAIPHQVTMPKDREASFAHIKSRKSVILSTLSTFDWQRAWRPEATRHG